MVLVLAWALARPVSGSHHTGPVGQGIPRCPGNMVITATA
jgi:hypothetical protein